MIYIQRHGQTEANRDGIFQGHCDFPLTELGKKQAEFCSTSFKLKQFDYVFCSPLKRCRDTFFYSSKNISYGSLIFDENLIEMYFGECEGKKHEDILKTYSPANFLSLNKERFPGGENIYDMIYRGYVFKNTYKEILFNKNVLIITHKLMGNALKAALLDCDYHSLDFLGHLTYSTIDSLTKEIINVNLKDCFNATN